MFAVIVADTASHRPEGRLVIREGYLAAGEAAAKLLAHPAVAEAWDKPSALARYTVSGLAGHLAAQVNVVAKVLDGPESDPDTEPPDFPERFRPTA